MYPKTSTPRYQMHLPRTGSCENTLDVADPRPPQRSRSYDPDFRAPGSKVCNFTIIETVHSPPFVRGFLSSLNAGKEQRVIERL